MEKYGVASVQADQRKALEAAKARRESLLADLEKTAWATMESGGLTYRLGVVEGEIAELEAALQQ
jgi:hypothetical protein